MGIDKVGCKRTEEGHSHAYLGEFSVGPAKPVLSMFLFSALSRAANENHCAANRRSKRIAGKTILS